MKYILPTNFLIGSAFSGPQTEGHLLHEKKSPSIYDEWFLKEPQKFFQETDCQNDFLKNYQSDILLAKQAKLNSLRTSIQWTRLLPDGKNVDLEAVKIYQNIFDCMLANNIEPIINLHHFDVPMWLHIKGGWTNRESISAFTLFAETCFYYFGDKIKKWTTFNEPDGALDNGYLAQYSPPGIVNFNLAMQAYWHMLLAHFNAVKAFRECKKVKEGQIGLITVLNQPIARSNSDYDIVALKFAKSYLHRFGYPAIKNKIDPLLLEYANKYNFMWKSETEDWNLIADKNLKIDFLGLNYYAPSRIKAPEYQCKPSDVQGPWNFFVTYDLPYKRVNPYRGWEIYPQGIYENLMMVKKEYDNIPVYIAENGFGKADEKLNQNDKTLDDSYRINFFKEHLAYIVQAIAEGSNCFGYHIWTFIDNWSWANAYKNRYGIIGLDLETKERYLKKSFYWFQELLTTNTFDFDYDVKTRLTQFLGKF